MSSRKTLSLILFLVLVTFGVLFVDSLSKPPAGEVTTTAEDELVIVLGNPEGQTPPPELISIDELEGEQGVDWHIVEKGETLRAIALRFWGDAELDMELAALNQLRDPDRIEEGLLLRLR